MTGGEAVGSVLVECTVNFVHMTFCVDIYTKLLSVAVCACKATAASVLSETAFKVSAGRVTSDALTLEAAG